MKTMNLQPRILAFGNDSRLAYLLNRYVEDSNCDLVMQPAVPSLQELLHMQPSAVIFPSLEMLIAARDLVNELLPMDIFILACVSVLDEDLAREMGADVCLQHPLTYEKFWSTISTICSSPEN